MRALYRTIFFYILQGSYFRATSFSRYLTFLLLVGPFLQPLPLTSEEEGKYANKIIEEAFITFATKDYFPLVEVLLDSVKAFSMRPIVVFGVNADVPFSYQKYPFLVKKRIDISPLTRENVWLSKHRTILEAKVRRGVYLDADLILNDGCDTLFKYCKKVKNYPLCPLFPSEVNNQQLLMEVMGVKRKSMPYVHAPLIIFSEKCFSFIREWGECNAKFGHLANPVCHDETIFNVLLWKYQATDFINICDPWYTLAYDHVNGGTEQHHLHGYTKWIGKMDYYTFHGCKNPVEAKKILSLLIGRKKSHDTFKAEQKKKRKQPYEKRLVKGSEDANRIIEAICH